MQIPIYFSTDSLLTLSVLSVQVSAKKTLYLLASQAGWFGRTKPLCFQPAAPKMGLNNHLSRIAQYLTSTLGFSIKPLAGVSGGFSLP